MYWGHGDRPVFPISSRILHILNIENLGKYTKLQEILFTKKKLCSEIEFKFKELILKNA